MDDDDFDDSMAALAAALAANIPIGTGNTYRIGVVTFASSASVDVTPVAINTQADLDAVVATLNGIATAAIDQTTGTTNYEDALRDLHAAFINSFGSLGNNSLINMMTDGSPTECNVTPTECSTSASGIAASAAAALTAAQDLRTAGWDSLSFEAVDTITTNVLNNLAFDTGGFGVGGAIANPNQITDPLNSTFVITLSSANIGAGYSAAVNKKIQRIVDPTNPIPVPGSLPLVATGLGLIGFFRLRAKRS